MSDDLDREGASVSIRNGIHFHGANVFILACAIVIASVGLNVNSIPVIIGAMLISPVMAPILGFGFGLGIRDNQLVRDSLKNFLIMVSISIGASFLYFLLSPLHLENPTELLARTNPTIYDVLIALFGGFAGILELSRKKKGTVLSGVAIATALMPPLCTVGYGLSLFNARYIFGALYLFLINSVFIALATFIIVKYLKYPVVSVGDSKKRLSKRSVTVLLLLVIIPSVFSAVRIVRESNFSRHTQQLVSNHNTIGRSYIYDHKNHFSFRHASVELFVAGPSPLESFYSTAAEYGIKRSQIVFSDNNLVTGIAALESDMVKELYNASEQRQVVLSDSIKRLDDSLALYRAQDALCDAVAREVVVQYPSITRVVLGKARTLSSAAGAQSASRFVVLVETTVPLSQAELDKLEAWLRVRLDQKQVSVIQSSPSK
jgi:uncharacterized hydrophobic protein (TIGR00271 family)